MPRRNNFVQLSLFFSKNKKFFTVIISVIFFAGLLVNELFQNIHKNNLATKNISSWYENTINVIRTGQPKSFFVSEKFEEKNKNIYDVFLLLEEAKKFVNRNNLEEAASRLQCGLSIVKDETMKDLINLRLARIQLQQKRINDVLKTLESIKTEELSSLISDFRGEVLLSSGDKLGARSMWEAGLRESPSLLTSEILQMKIDNLSL